MTAFESEPLVSVVVPMYRVESCIDATIRSVLAQTYANFELLLVDDGSPDDTVERCRAYASDPRVVLLRQPNRGCPAARNLGIRRARGSLLAMLDGDDTWSPSKLERHVRELSRSPSVGISYCGAVLIDEVGRSLRLSHCPPAGSVELVSLFRNNPICTPSATLVRREVFSAIRFDGRDGEPAYFDDTLECADDFECWVRVLATTSWRITGIAESLVQYRVRAQSNTAEVDLYPQRWRHVVAQIARYAPGLVAEHGDAATARILRYLAQRKFLGLGSASDAARLAREAVVTDVSMLGQEPFRTLLTLASTHAALFLPATGRPALIDFGRRALSRLEQLGALRSPRMRFDGS